MAEYIDRDKLNEFIEKRGAGLGITVANCCNFKDIVKMLPTEDVVPISEVEKAKQEVAKQIFEEIETRLLSYSTPTFNDKHKPIIQLNTAIYGSLAELKKKYIGE